MKGIARSAVRWSFCFQVFLTLALCKAWCSDNSDAFSRTRIQMGTSMWARRPGHRRWSTMTLSSKHSGPCAMYGCPYCSMPHPQSVSQVDFPTILDYCSFKFAWKAFLVQHFTSPLRAVRREMIRHADKVPHTVESCPVMLARS